MDRASISSRQLLCVAAVTSLAGFLLDFNRSASFIELLLGVLLEAALVLLISRVAEPGRIVAILAALYFETRVAAIILSLKNAMAISGTVAWAVCIIAVLVAIRSAGFGCEAVGRFSAIAAVFALVCFAVLTVAARSLLELRYLAGLFGVPTDSFYVPRLAWLPLPGMLLAVLGRNLKNEDRIPAIRTAAMILAGKLIMVILAMAAMGRLSFAGEPSFLVIASAAGAGATMVAELLLIGVHTVSAGACLLASSELLGCKGPWTLVLALPAAAAAIFGGVV